VAQHSSGRINRVVEDIRSIDLHDVPSGSLNRMLLEAVAIRDERAAALQRLVDDVARARAAGEWHRMMLLRDEVLSLHEDYREAEKHVKRLHDAFHGRLLEERVLQRLGNQRNVLLVEYGILVLTILVLALLAVETFYVLSDSARGAFAMIDTAVCVLFLVEFFWRMRQAENHMWYLERYWIDFLASLPVSGLFQIARVERAARGARAWFRLIRVLRLARVLRGARAVPFLSRGFDQIAAALRVDAFRRPLLLTLLLLVIGAMAISKYEGPSDPNVAGLWQGTWWSFTTVITGGFGDIHNPESTMGRLLTAALVILGIVLTGALTAGLAKVLLGEETDRLQRQYARLEARLQEMTHRIGERHP